MTASEDPSDPPRRDDLGDLADRVARGRVQAGLTPPPPRHAAGTAAGDGLRIAIEFVVSVLVGAGLGWVIGGFAGSAVAGLLLGLAFGFAAGLRGVYRGMMAGAGTPPQTGTDGTDDADR